MSSWSGKTRGGLLGYKIFVFILKRFGLKSAYILLRFVVAYFLIFAPSSTKSIYIYFRTILKYSSLKSLLSVYKCYYVFGQTLIDKIAISSGLQNKFTFSTDGVEHLEELKSKGGIIISAHLGSWDVAGLLLDEINLKTNVLMFEAEHEKIKAYLDQVMKGKSFNVIPILPDFSHIFKINEAIKNKEVVCMHGDRFVEGSRFIEKEFLGKKANFPLGPFSIVSKLNVPYSFAFALRDHNQHYLLSATPIMDNVTSAEQVLDNYLETLEAKLLTKPHQWFNFYRFWNN